jgi:hypothetical protein
MSIKSMTKDDIVATAIAVIPSANVITLHPAINSKEIFRLTGNTTVKTINKPADDPYFYGPVWFFNTDAAVGTWDATGNIALAGTFTRYKLFAFIFDTTTNLWYPSATA